MVEEQLTAQQRWNRRNKDKLAEATRKWRKANKEKAKACCRDWKRKNPDKHCALQMKRKAAKLKRTPKWADLKAIEEFYAEAARRSEEEGVAYQVDHVIPLQGKYVSGLHVQNNLQVITAVDNQLKGNKYSGY